jgi:hypothetical protein
MFGTTKKVSSKTGHDSAPSPRKLSKAAKHAATLVALPSPEETSIFTSKLTYSEELKKQIWVHEVEKNLKGSTPEKRGLRNLLTKNTPHPLNCKCDFLGAILLLQQMGPSRLPRLIPS